MKTESKILMSNFLCWMICLVLTGFAIIYMSKSNLGNEAFFALTLFLIFVCSVFIFVTVELTDNIKTFYLKEVKPKFFITSVATWLIILVLALYAYVGNQEFKRELETHMGYCRSVALGEIPDYKVWRKTECSETRLSEVKQLYKKYY
jgi:hypothetical protein